MLYLGRLDVIDSVLSGRVLGVRKKIAIMAILLITLAIAATTVSAEGKDSRDYLVSTTIVLIGDGGGKSAEAIPVKAGDYFKVVLYAAGGTGYEWVLENKDLKLVEAVDEFINPVDGAQNLPGGQVRWVFYLQLKADALGQETLQFALKRPWEPKAEPAQVFGLTVTAKE